MRNWKVWAGGAVGLAVAATAVVAVTSPAADAATVTVYKSPTCGCCNAWIEHMREAGFTVEAVDMTDVGQIKQEHGIAPENTSCHTALVDGYWVEGHVPADLVQKMLNERPEIAGLAVPGMPMGSPGMEGPRKDPYNVYAVSADGSRSVYASR